MNNARSLLLTACLLAGCASGPQVQTDRDPAAVFSGYRTFAWKQQPPITNPLLQQRVVAAIEGQLADKGWRPAPDAEADVLLVGNVSATDQQTINAFYDGLAWREWDYRGNVHPGLGLQRVEVRSYKLGALVLDMFDARTRRAVWRAVAEGEVPSDPARREADAMLAVERMFSGFPPPDAPVP